MTRRFLSRDDWLELVLVVVVGSVGLFLVLTFGEVGNGTTPISPVLQEYYQEFNQ